MERDRDAFWLGAILILALALRVIGLNSPLWFDEIVTVQTHLRLGWGEMLQSYSMNHHYLHNLAAKLSMSLLGDAPWAIRLPAMLFGLGGIAAMWVLARDIAGRLPAHATALLMALSYHHIWFSQNARGYTGLALFSTLSLIFFLRGLQAPTLRVWLLFAASIAATIFTHLTGAFFVAALGLIWVALVLFKMMSRKPVAGLVRLPFVGFLVGGLITLALYAPIIPSMVAGISAVAGTSAVDPMQEYQNPLWAAYEGLRTGLGQAGPMVATVGLLVLGLAVLGSLSLRRSAPLFGLITFGHIILTVAILLGVGMRIWPRFFFTDIALVLFLIVLGVQSCCRLLTRVTPEPLGRALFPLALVTMALISSAMALRNYSAPKQDLWAAFQQVEAARVPGERAYAISYSGEIFSGYFHADWGTIWTAEDYQTAFGTPGPLTIVVTFPDRNLREYPAIEADRVAGLLVERAVLPGTLGDGTILILHRD